MYAGSPTLLAAAARVGLDPDSGWMERPPGRSRQGMHRPTALTPAPIRDINRHRHKADELPEPRASGLTEEMDRAHGRPPEDSRHRAHEELHLSSAYKSRIDRVRAPANSSTQRSGEQPQPANPRIRKRTRSNRAEIGLQVATKPGAGCQFWYACRFGSACHGQHDECEQELFKQWERKVFILERSGQCVYCGARARARVKLLVSSLT